MRTAEKNRYQNSMNISRIRIDCVLTDPFGLSATRIMDYLLSGELFDEEKCRSLINHRVKASKDEAKDAVHGYHILEEQKFKMTHAKAHMDFINKSIDEIEAELFLRSRQYDIQIKQSATVTGITELSALFILSEIGADMSVFESDRHLCSWAGLTPTNNESANKKTQTREEMQDAIKDMAMLQGKMDSHLGYSSNERGEKDTADRRNGYSHKSVNTAYGKLDVPVPKDRDGSFTPKAIPNAQKTSAGSKTKYYPCMREA